MIQPNHGAFPELIASTGGGLLFDTDDRGQLAASIERLKLSPDLRKQLGDEGARGVMERHTIERAAAELKRLCFGSNPS